MASLLNWLGKQATGIVAQINPWDNGATYASVMQEEERKRRQTPRPQTPRPQPQQQQPRGPVIVPYGQQQPQTGASIVQRELQRTAPQQRQQESVRVGLSANAELSRKQQELAQQKQNAIEIPGMGVYSKQKDGTYLNQAGQKRTQEQIDKLRGIANEDAKRQAQIKKQGVNPGTIAQEVANATAKLGEYANPLGRQGIFGEQQQRRVDNATKPIINHLEQVQKDIDKSDNQEGFQWTSPGDYGRFAQKLLPGMAQGIIEAPQKVGSAVSGVRVGEDGNIENINGLQRGGSFVDGFVSVAGLPMGGSGTLIKSVFGQAAKEAAKQTTKEAAKQTFVQIARQSLGHLAKDSGTEAIEEVIQTFASDLADNGQLDATAMDYWNSATMGALGGGMMHGAGKLVQAGKNIPTQVDKLTHNELVQKNPQYAQLDAAVKTSPSLRERADLQRQMQAMRTEAKVDAWRQANEFTARRLVPGGTLAGPLSKGYKDAQAKGLVFDGVDGKPRFEVDDSGAKIADAEGKTLGDMLDHPKLFENYPDLKDAPIEYDMRGDLGPASAAVQNLPNGKMGILVNPSFASQPEKLKSYLLHETQHLIQKNEGFARGTSPETAIADFNKVFDKKHGKRLSEINDEILSIQSDENFSKTEAELNKVYQQLFDGDVNDPTLNKRAEELEKLISKENSRITKLSEERRAIESQRISDMDAYERSAGEAEARAVQARMDMPMSERYVKGKTLYRGGKPFDKKLVGSDGTSFSTDKAIADRWRGSYKGGVIEQFQLKSDAKVLVAPKPDVPLGSLTDSDKFSLVADASRKGYDAVDMSSWGEKEIRVINPDSLQDSQAKSTFYDSLDVPKEDLIMRNEGGKAMSVEKDPLESLKQEARKYKRAEEFVGKDNTQFADLPNYKFDVAQAQKDFAEIQNLTEKITTGMPKDATKAQRVKVYKDTITAVNKKYGTNISTDINDILDVTRNSNKYPSELAYEAGKKAKTDIYNQAHAEAKAPVTTAQPHPNPGVDARVKRALDPNDKLQYKNLNAAERVAYKEAKGASQQDAKPAPASRKAQPTKQTSSPQVATAAPRSASSQPAVARTENQPSTKKSGSTPKPQQSSQSTQSRTDSEPRYSYTHNMTDSQAKQYVDQMNKAQETARKRSKDGMKESASETLGDFREKFMDDLAPIEDRLNKAIKRGAVVDPKDHITYQLDRTRRAEGIVHAHVRDSGLADIIQNVPNAKEFDQYLIAKHARELDPEIRTGRDQAKDAALVKKLDGKYKDYAKQVYEYNQKLLDKSVEYGLISKQTATDLKKKYPEYVPFNRVFNEDELTKLSGVGGGEASLSSQSAVQKIKGSQRAIDSPLNSIIDKTRVVIEQGERNQAAKMLASYRSLPGNPFNLKRLPDGEAIGTRSSISYLEKGQKVTYLTDKTIADAAKGMTRQQIGLWGRVLSAPTRLLRAGATTANAGFAGANVVKDVVGAAINSKNTLDLANVQVIGKALAAAFHHNGKYYSELMREGVSGTSFDMYRNMPDLNIKEIRSHKNLATRAAHNANPKNWFRTVENTIGRSEDFGRAYQYYANKRGFERKGMDDSLAKLLAADEARHNSTNFFRHGSYGRNINLAIPYWNAGVQGARITARRVKERPVATLTKLGFTIAAPSAMIALNNYQDEEKRKVIENIPDYEKEGNIIIIGDNAKFNEETGRWEDVHKWPVPPQWLGIHNAIQEGVKSIVTGEAYDAVEHAGNVAENLTTVNPTDLTKTANNYIPQLVKLIAEPMTNTNFFTRDKIVPEAMQNLDAKDQKTKATSGVARVLSKLTGASPMQIDNSIRTGTGGAGQNVVWAIDKMLEATGAIGQGEGRGRNPIDSVTDRFMGARGTSDGVIYFKTLDEAAKNHKLTGKDLSIFNSLVDSKMNSKGEIQGKNERDALNKYQNLASHPNVAKAFADAAKERSRQTGEPIDPLYRLDHAKQMKFYNIKAQNRDSQDQRDLENREASWYKDFARERAEYFKALDLKPSGTSNRVKYPEPNEKVQKLIDTYYNEKNLDKKYKMLDDHPEITKHFENLADYTNEVRKGQGVNPLRKYPQASKEVQQMMDAGNFKDERVQRYMQDLNLYNMTLEASLAQIQGNEMSSKGLKATKNLGYSIVKNDDGTYSLKFSDKQGEAGKSTGKGGGKSSGSGSRSGRRKSAGRGGKAKENYSVVLDATKAANKLKAPKTTAYSGKKSPIAAAQMKKTQLKSYRVTKPKSEKELIRTRKRKVA